MLNDRALRSRSAVALILMLSLVSACGLPSKNNSNGGPHVAAEPASTISTTSSLAIPSAWRAGAPTAVEVYAAGSVTVAEGLVVRSDGASGGVLLNFPGPRWKRSLLRLEGNALKGKATLRVRNGTSEPTYSPAPSGTSSLIVEGGNSLEVLLYADEAFVYHLKSASLLPCPSCPVEQDLRERALKDVPELARALRVDRAAAAVMLLRWAAPKIDFARDPAVLTRTDVAPLSRNPAQVLAHIFDPSTGGVYCGGAAVFFDGVLKAFDFPSFTLNFGDRRDDLTHVTVVVPLQQESGTVYAVLDPTFNTVFRHEDGSFLDVRALVRLARGNSMLADARLDFEPLLDRQFVFRDQVPADCDGEVSDAGHLRSCQIARFNLDRYLRDFADRMSSHGYAPNLEGFGDLLANQIFSVGTSLEPEAPGQLLEALEQLGVTTEAAGSAG